MQFAKLRQGARFNLATSGVMNCVLGDLDTDLNGLELFGPSTYGQAPLMERIASRYGVRPDNVVTAAGCSFANHLALAALVEPGDQVLVEEPTYELLLAALGYLQADIVRFQRRAEDGFRLDPEALARAITPRTRLVVLTELHNPSSVRADAATLAAVSQTVRASGARLFVDEVYLDLAYADAPPSAFHLGEHVVITSSLTKAYGLSALRCGWILASPELCERMWKLNDLYYVHPPFLAEQLSMRAFDRLAYFRARTDRLLDANRAAYRELLGGHPRLEQTVPGAGTTVFARLLGEDVEAFCARLRADFETTVVPGRFFERPDHIRIGLGGEAKMTREGLEQLARALG
jgi:aspartate/methionine/tyrosine aminotransferase